MAPSRTRFAVAISTLSITAFGALWACEDSDGGQGVSTELDGAPNGYDASLRDAPPVPEPDASKPVDASSPDADAHVDPLRGIWRGVGDQGGGTTWTILLDLVDGEPKGPPGTVVGIMTYPSLACGGTLVVSDAGPPDSGTIDGGISLTLHESVSARCVQEGEDTSTLTPDGGLYFEYREVPNGPVGAFGSLSRVDDVGSASTAFRGIWRNGDPNLSNLRPVLVSISRDDKVGAASGTFLFAAPNGIDGCGGHWTLAGKTASTLTLTEVFNDEQAGCTGPGSVTLQAITGALEYARTLDGGAAGDAATLTPF